MTNRQKIELKLSEIRQRLNEIAGIKDDDFSEKIRNEADALQGEYKNLEVRHRAAITSETEDEAKMRGEFRDDVEGVEMRALVNRCNAGTHIRCGRGEPLTRWRGSRTPEASRLRRKSDPPRTLARAWPRS